MFMTLEPMLLETHVFSDGRKEQFSQISKKDALVSLESPTFLGYLRVCMALASLFLSLLFSAQMAPPTLWTIKERITD